MANRLNSINDTLKDAQDTIDKFRMEQSLKRFKDLPGLNPPVSPDEESLEERVSRALNANYTPVKKNAPAWGAGFDPRGDLGQTTAQQQAQKEGRLIQPKTMGELLVGLGANKFNYVGGEQQWDEWQTPGVDLPLGKRLDLKGLADFGISVATDPTAYVLGAKGAKQVAEGAGKLAQEAKPVLKDIATSEVGSVGKVPKKGKIVPKEGTVESTANAVKGTAKEPWQMTRDEIGEVLATKGGSYKDAEGTVWSFTGKKKEVGLTYLRRATSPGKKPVDVSMRQVFDNHEYAIKQALSEGKPVPPEVLKDYPELIKGLTPKIETPAPKIEQPIKPLEKPTGLTPEASIAQGKGIPPIETTRRPLWQGKTDIANEPPKPPKPPTAVGASPELPSGRKPGGIEKQAPLQPTNEYQKLLEALSPPKTSIAQRVTDAKAKIMRAFYVDWNPTRGLAKETGIPVDKYFQVVPGATAAGEDIIRRSYMPVLKRVAKDIDYLEQYMVSMRNLDILGRNPSARLPGGVSGYGGTLKNIETIKVKVGSERFKEIESAAKELWQLNDDHVLKPMLKEGLIDTGKYTAIKSSNPHYIPFQREDFTTGIQSHFTGRSKANVSSAGIKKLSYEGSERALDEPLARLQAEVIKTQSLIARNKAAKSLVDALKEAEKQVGEPLVKTLESSETRLARRVTGENISTVGKAEHSNLLDTVSYFENGQKVMVQVPAIYGQVAKGLEAESVNLLNKMLRTLSAPLRQGAVTYNPAFLIVNPIRDAMSAFFREKLVPLSPDYIRGWVSVIKKDALFSEAAKSGTLMSGIVDTMRTTNAVKRVNQLGAITINNPKDILTVLPKLVAKANLTAEQATRVAVFGKLRAQGIDGLEAAVRARDVTVDFAKMGTWMRVINDVIPFSNAGLQGSANVLRTLKNNPKWAGVATAPFVMATVLSRTNNMRYETSKLIPDYEYTNNWVVQIGEFTKADGKKAPLYIKIPKGQLGSMLTFPGEALFNLARSDNDRSAVEAILDTGTEAVKASAPFGSDLTSFLPPLAQTAASLQTGRDTFTGNEIVPYGEKKLPEEEQFGKDTSSTAVALGQAFNVSPRKIEFAIKDYTAGTGQTSLWLLDLGLGALGYNPEGSTELTTEEAISKVPGVSRFVGTRNTRPYYLGQETQSTSNTSMPTPSWLEPPKSTPKRITITPKPKTKFKAPSRSYQGGGFKPYSIPVK